MQPGLRFRRAAAADVPALVALLADDGLGRERDDPRPPLDPGYLRAFAAIAADPNQLLAVAVSGSESHEEAQAEAYPGEVVGCLQITFIPGLSRRGMWRGQIESVRIAAARRGQGLGRAMLEWAIAECRQRGCGIVQLTTDKSRGDAQRLYRRLGFVASHEGMKLTL